MVTAFYGGAFDLIFGGFIKLIRASITFLYGERNFVKMPISSGREINRAYQETQGTHQILIHIMSHVVLIEENKRQPVAAWNRLQVSNSVLQMNWYDVEVPIDTPLPFETSSHSNEPCI